MIRVTTRELRAPLFRQALTILAGHSFPDPKVSFNFMRIIKRLEMEDKVKQDAFVGLVNKFALKDEKGELVGNNGEAGTYQIPEPNVKLWGEAIRAYEAQVIEIDREKIPVAALNGAKLTPAHLSALDPILAE